MFILNISKFIFLTLLGQSPAIFTSWFTLSNSIHTHATTSTTIINRDHHFDSGTVTSTKTLFTKGSKLAKYGARMIRVSGPVIWNRLPTEIQDSPSLPTFKIRLKNIYSVYTLTTKTYIISLQIRPNSNHFTSSLNIISYFFLTVNPFIHLFFSLLYYYLSLSLFPFLYFIIN